MHRKRNYDETLEYIATSVATSLYDKCTDEQPNQSSMDDWEKHALVHLKSMKPEEIHIESGWCVTVIEACPDYKRPCSNTTVMHFRNEADAQSFAREIWIQKFIQYELIDADDVDTITDEMIEKLDEQLCDIIYCDSYMDMPPIEVRVSKIVCE
jgi:hypothetical protein